jgi:hypothetical protein
MCRNNTAFNGILLFDNAFLAQKHDNTQACPRFVEETRWADTIKQKCTTHQKGNADSETDGTHDVFWNQKTTTNKSHKFVGNRSRERGHWSKQTTQQSVHHGVVERNQNGVSAHPVWC